MKDQHQTESEFVGKEHCPACGSKDNLGRYSDGHAFCFGQGCGYYEPPTGEEARRVVTAKADFEPLEGEFKRLDKRKISAETCRLFRYRVTRYKGDAAHVVDVVDWRTGSLLAQKIRTRDKDFPILGDVSKKPLIGAHLWSGGKRLIVTEGEIDALTVSEVQGNKWPTVSILNGASGAKKNLLANLDYLKLFEEVVLLFDMDEPGQDAARECAEALMSVAKVKIARLPLKDPNEMHVAGRDRELIAAIWNAEEFKPDGLLYAEDLISQALEEMEPGLPWMFDGMNKSSNGRHYGEIHTIGAGTGVGKTDLILQQADYDVRVLGLSVGLFLVENDPVEVLQYLAGKAEGRFYYEPGHPDRQDKEAMARAMAVYSGKVAIYDNFGLCDWELIKARVLYLIQQGVRVFYVDHLTALATGGEKDEKEELENLMADVAEFAKRHNVLFILISHLATAEGKAHEEGGRVSIKQFKGSRAIGFWSHAMYGLERDQQAEDQETRQTTAIRQLKRRKFGKGVGRVTYARYDPKTGLSKEVSGFEPFQDESSHEDQDL